MSKKQKNAIKKTLIDLIHSAIFGLAIAAFYAQWILR